MTDRIEDVEELSNAAVQALLDLQAHCLTDSGCEVVVRHCHADFQRINSLVKTLLIICATEEMRERESYALRRKMGQEIRSE